MVWERNLVGVAINTPDIAEILSKNDFPMEMLTQEAAEVEELVERNPIQERAKVRKTETRPDTEIV